MMLWKSVYHGEKEKITRKFQNLPKCDLILLANTLTSVLVQYHLNKVFVSQLPSQLVNWSYIEEIPML